MCIRDRLEIDYSETINRFTLLDGYRRPRIDDMVNKIAQYRVFSSIDLRSADHQLPIKDEDKPYTAFESDGSLYTSLRLFHLELPMVLLVSRESWMHSLKKRTLMPHLHILTM